MPVGNPGKVNRTGSGLVKQVTPTEAAGTFLGDDNVLYFDTGCVIDQNACIKRFPKYLCTLCRFYF